LVYFDHYLFGLAFRFYFHFDLYFYRRHLTLFYHFHLEILSDFAFRFRVLDAKLLFIKKQLAMLLSIDFKM